MAVKQLKWQLRYQARKGTRSTREKTKRVTLLSGPTVHSLYCASMFPTQNGSDNSEKYSRNNTIQVKLGKHFVDLLSLHYGQKVLDMGCGTGELTAHIANLVGSENVFGVDPNESRIQIAIQTAKNTNFTVGSSSSYFPHYNEGFYDVHFSNFVFHWLNRKEKEDYFERARNCLKPGGRLAIHGAGQRPQTLEALLEMAVSVKAIEPAPYFVKRETVDSMFTDFGFQIVSSESLSYEFNFASIESFLSWTCATFYIDEAYFSSLVGKERLMKFTDKDKKVHFKHEAYRIVGIKSNTNS